MAELLQTFTSNPVFLEMLLNALSFIAESTGVVAQVGLDAFVIRILNMFRIVSLIFAVAGVMYAAWQLNSGDIRAAFLGICAAGLMGASYLIVVALFPEQGDFGDFEISIDF